jgi:hypothetical protein
MMSTVIVGYVIVHQYRLPLAKKNAGGKQCVR